MCIQKAMIIIKLFCAGVLSYRKYQYNRTNTPLPSFSQKERGLREKIKKKKKLTKNYMKLRGGMREKLGRNFHMCAVYEVHDSPTCTFLKLEICGFYLLN